MSHTPGPWVLDPAEPFTVVNHPHGPGVAYTIALVGGRMAGHGSQAANARLIASAPDLLAALEALADALALSDADAYALQPETADRLNGLRCRAQNVIKKATVAP